MERDEVAGQSGDLVNKKDISGERHVYYQGYQRQEEKVAEYKGKKYKLLWSGQTRYGRRAKLSFFNNVKEFWVDESAITITTARQEEEARLEHLANQVGEAEAYGY